MALHEKPYGAGNPHPLSQMTDEFVWEGKYDEFGLRRQPSLPPFSLGMRLVEKMNGPQYKESIDDLAKSGEFRNRLIWGDNKLAMATLLEEFRGKVKLIYIDPPFDTGADFSFSATIPNHPDSGDDGVAAAANPAGHFLYL